MKRIKKCLLFLFFIMLFIPLTVENAGAKATCSDVKEAVNQLETINNDIKTLKCDEATTDKLLAQCNKLAVNKASVLESIFEYNEDKICPSIKLNSIINEYSDDCTEGFTSSVKAFADSVMNFFYITAPFILIIFGSLDFFKIVAGASPEEIKKHRQNFVKRLIAFLLLYITPFFVKTIFSITPYNIDGADYVCSQEISFTPKITSEAVTGYYSEDNYGSGDAGKRIAEAAKKNAAFAKTHGFTYGCFSTLKNAYTSNNSYKKVCCATLVNASLYSAKIYKASEFGSFIHSAPATTTFLLKKGWKFIKTTNEKDLKPGDVLIYECNNKCNTVTPPPVINGKTVHIGHVAIYAGNGKQYDHGLTEWIEKGTINFWSKGGSKHLYGALRYTGN